MKIRPVEAVVLHSGRQTHRHEEDNPLFEILRTRCQNRNTHTHTHHLCTQVLLSHYIIKGSLKVLAIAEVMPFATVHLLIYCKFSYF